jgi:excisionase family DNA binding protein
MEMSMQRMADLERRVMALEERTRRSLWTQEAVLVSKEEELLGRYGEYVDKTMTAQILGVTRATVYAMLSDGRIEGACSGRRVSVRSIANYMVAPKSRGKQQKVKPA